jgi:competence protein ComEA
MATKGERRALLFLAAVALLGAGTRAYRARPAAVDASDLDRQIAAVEASRTSDRRRAPARKGTRAGKGAASDGDRALPPSAPLSVREPLDLDRATEAEIDRLPGVGPVIAKRIVADRDSGGPFGCLKALDGVKGVGPALIGRIDALVTFSGAARARCAQR